VSQVIQIIGSLLVLAAFAAAQRGLLDPKSVVTLNNYAYLNLTQGNTEVAFDYGERARAAASSVPADMPLPNTIANAVERMTRLIEQLRDLPRGSRSQILPLDNLVRQAVARCSLRTPVPTLSLAGEIPVYVQADPERLAAVLDHVLRNAQDATPEGTVEVQLSLSSAEASLVVRDTGKGMDPEFIRERLFRPFDSTKGSKGMGIGAYQTREYVQSLGGRVEVQSSPGSGTAFSIILPLATAPQAAQPAITE